MKKNLKNFIFALAFFTAFIVWTILVLTVDVKPIGPQGSKVGLSTMNGLFRDFVGSDLTLYSVTDWLGLVPIAFALGFAVLGFIQLVKRKSLLKVDADILVLGCYYLAVIFFYFLFEYAVINRRPILINGYLEASYPSSTTLLTISVIATAIFQLRGRLKNGALKTAVIVVLWAFTTFMVIGRLVSGVHWLSDIIGGILLSAGLVMLYVAVVNAVKKNRSPNGN